MQPRRILRSLVPPAVIQLLWKRHVSRLGIPDPDWYRPFLEPWRSPAFQRLFAEVSTHSLLSPDRAWVLNSELRQAVTTPGAIYELGVYRGGSAALLQSVNQETGAGRTLRLFDTFEGMPAVDANRDLHSAGDFADTSEEEVRSLFAGLDNIDIRKGFIPATFAGLDADIICFAHIDLDIYRSILDACEFVYPRLSPGGVIVFDDYGFPSCPGARQAVDEFFSDKPEVPLSLSTAQAVVHRLPT